MQKPLHEVYQQKRDKRVSRLGPREPEGEVRRIYGLYRAKLPPKKLRLLSLVNVGMVLAAMGLLAAGVLLMPKPTDSLLEQRPLTKWPDFSLEHLFSGAYTAQIRDYVADTFPLRESFVGLAASWEQSWGLRIDDVRVVTGGGNEPQAQPIAISNSTSEGTTPTGETVGSVPMDHGASTVPEGAADDGNSGVSLSETPETAQADVEGTVYNGIFITEGRAMSLFGGNPAAAKRYASTLSAYQQAMPHVQVYNLLIPTAAEFNLPEKYVSLSGSQKDIIDTVYAALDPAVKAVDAYSALAAHKNEYLYFNTDHHWTGLGAYYAYTAYCETAGLTPVPLWQMEKRTLTDFVGTMYSQSQDATLLQNPDYVDYFIPPVDYTAWRYDRGAPYAGKTHSLWGEYAKSPNSYSVFLQGDFPLVHVVTENKNGRRLLMVKESFGNAFAPFLINHYEEVFIVDQRYFELPMVSFMQERNIQELLFINNAFAVCTPYHIDCIAQLVYGHIYTPPKAETPAPTPTPVPAPTPAGDRPRLGALRNRERT